MDHFDICIVGAGVIGLAIAQKLSQRKDSIVLLERNRNFGEETSSRNSEVIHAGLYYANNSLKARLCVEGNTLLYQYCEENRLPHRKIGKYIVAQKHQEEQLAALYQLAKSNGVTDLQCCSQSQIHDAEPLVQASLGLYSPSSGIIDSHAFMQSLLQRAEINGLCFSARTKVLGIEKQSHGFVVQSLCGDRNSRNQEEYSFSCEMLINAAGLEAPGLAKTIIGLAQDTIPSLYFCKGNYFNLSGKAPFSHLIYPMPDANNKGLGIHATLDLAGQLRFGPDTEYITHLNYKVSQQNVASFYQAIRRYYPGLKEQSLTPAYAGIRPKLQAPGKAAEDFLIQTESEHRMPGLIQLFGIESPGLTASLAIANHINNLIPL